MSSMFDSSRVSSCWVSVAQPPSSAKMSSHRPHSVQFRRMGGLLPMGNPATPGVVINGQRLLQMHGYPGAGLYIHRRKGLAVEFVDPVGHVAHVAGEDALHHLTAADADRAQRAVAAGHHRHTVLTG